MADGETGDVVDVGDRGAEDGAGDNERPFEIGGPKIQELRDGRSAREGRCCFGWSLSRLSGARSMASSCCWNRWLEKKDTSHCSFKATIAVA